MAGRAAGGIGWEVLHAPHVVSRANLGTVADDNGNENISPGLRAPGDVSRRKFVIYVEK